MDIDTWLGHFKDSWISHDVPGVLSLFDEHAEYHESPFVLLINRGAIEKAWEGIQYQDDIALAFTVFNAKDGTYSIIWDLKYTQTGERKHFAGTYLMRLNELNQCTYFFHCCESDGRNNS